MPGCKLLSGGCHGLGVPDDVFFLEGSVVVTRQMRQQCLQRGLNVADRTEGDVMPPAQMRGIDIDLHDSVFVGIELAPCKVGAEQQEGVTFEQGVVSRFVSQDSRHADVVWIARFEKALRARGMSNGCLEPLGHCHDLVERALAAGPRIDCDSLAVVEDSGDLLDIRVARPDGGAAMMDAIRVVVLYLAMGHIDGNDQHRDAAPGQRGLASHHRFFRARSGVRIISQNTEYSLKTDLKSISWMNSKPISLIAT